MINLHVLLYLPSHLLSMIIILGCLIETSLKFAYPSLRPTNYKLDDKYPWQITNEYLSISCVILSSQISSGELEINCYSWDVSLHASWHFKSGVYIQILLTCYRWHWSWYLSGFDYSSYKKRPVRCLQVCGW